MVARKVWMLKTAAVAALALACARADAQSPMEAYARGGEAQAPAPVAGPLAASDATLLKQAIDAAQAGDVTQARSVSASIADPLARKLVLWAMADSAGTSLGFFDVDSARRELTGWPRAARRQIAAERTLELASLAPNAIVQWFAGRDPTTAEGAMALASAYQQLGRIPEAQALVQRYWRDKPFEADAQSRMLARFGIYLTAEDHAKRLDMLLYGPQGPAAKAMLDLVTPEVRALGEARMALRANRDDANDLVGRVPVEMQEAPGLVFERARYLRKRNLDGLAAALVRSFPAPPAGYDDAADLIWTERRALMMSMLRTGDIQGAYAAVTNHGLTDGENYTEAEFFAGWIALTKLNNPGEAQVHFDNIRKVGTSPITLGRSWYWSGRAADARGDSATAERAWTEGAKYYTAFYGQLSAEKIGQTTLTLEPDPVANAEDKARFEGRDLVRAARMLYEAGERDLFRTFVLAADDTLPTAAELGLLVDLARLSGDQDLAMRVVRAGAQRGLYLPERGYPIRAVPAVSGAPEPALVHAIVRQESGFDPGVRSGVGARGMMQLMPTTAATVARRLGLDYSADRLNDPDYNMTLGSAFLGQLVDTFSGSYVMAAAGYNAGPGRPAKWAAECGDPRGGTTDPSDFIECIPFSETRNYVMRIMEAVQMYRARMNGGSAPLTLAADLKRGGWGVQPPPVPYNVATIGPTPYEPPVAGSGPGPIPYAALAQQSASEQRRVDVSARSDDHRRSPAKAERSAKKGGKAKASAGLKHKAKVTKAKAKGAKGGAVRRHKSRT